MYSVDDAPTIDLPEGRQLTWLEFGDPDGPAVVLLHGTPGSRHQFALRDAPGLPAARIICVDRPGYGGSTIDLAAMLDDTPRVVTALADHLGFDSFYVMGVSGGAPTAIATAALVPSRVRGVAAVSTAIPPHPDTVAAERAAAHESTTDTEPSAVAATSMSTEPEPGPPSNVTGGEDEGEGAEGDEDVALPPRRYSGRALRQCRMQVQLAKWWPSQALRSIKKHVAPSDAAYMDTDEFRTQFRRDTRHPSPTTAEAILLDVDQCGEFWLLPLEDVTAPVAIWHGSEDATVPVERARELHASLPTSSLHVVDGEGHFIASPHFGQILTDLVG